MKGFEDAFAVVCSPQVEGGYVNDPLDPGAETNFGITAETWARAEDAGIVAAGVRIVNRGPVEARAVYRAFYWDAYYCGTLPYPLALAFFDTVVNHSPTWAVKALQRAVGVAEDGAIGRATIDAANRKDPIGTAAEPGSVPRLLDVRMQHYLGHSPIGEAPISTAVEERFELGWCRRLLLILRVAMIAHFEVS